MIYYNISEIWRKGKIVNQPVDKGNDPYLIQDIDTGIINQVSFYFITETNTVPNNPPENAAGFPYHPWIAPNAKVTLFLPQQMKNPQKGYPTKHTGAT